MPALFGSISRSLDEERPDFVEALEIVQRHGRVVQSVTAVRILLQRRVEEAQSGGVELVLRQLAAGIRQLRVGDAAGVGQDFVHEPVRRRAVQIACRPIRRIRSFVVRSFG